MSVMVSLLSSWLLLIHVMSVGGVLHRSSGTAELMIASNSAEVRTYWHTMLPNTPMPPAILELLTPPAEQTSNGAWRPSNKVEDNKSNGVWGPSTKANDEKTHQVLWGPSIGNDVLKSNGQWGTSTKSEYPMSNAYTKIEDHNSNGLWGPTTTNEAQKSNAIWGSSTKAEDEKIQFGWVPSRRNKFRKSNGVWGTSTTTDLDKSNGVWGKSTNVEDQNIQFGWDPSTTNDAHKSNGLWGPSIKSKYEKSNGVWGPSTKDGGQKSNGVWGPSTKAGDQKNQFGWGPSTEDEDQKSNGVWGPSTKDGDQKSNGVWGPSTKSENQKGNGIWGPSTKYEDQKSNGVWGPSTKVEDQKSNGVWGPTTKDEDQKSNGIWGPSTKDEDRKSNGVWGPSTKSEDQNIQFEWGPSTKAENQKVNFIWGPFTTNDVQKSNGLWGPSTKDEQKKGDRKGDPLQELAGESNIGQGNHKHGTMSNMVFVEEALKVGSTITCYILPSSTTGAPLLQRDVADSIPMSMGNFTDILTMFAPVSNGMATDIWSTLDFCEHPQAIKGETKACATSVESMVEFAGSVLGVSTYNLRAFSSPDVPVEGVMSGRGYKVAAATRITQARDTITCHGMRFPFSMFMCHAVNPTRVYSVTLEGPADAAGADGAVQRMEVLAVCHLDTSEFDPAKMPVHVKPGEAPLCHFVSRDSILWAPAAPTSGHAAA